LGIEYETKVVKENSSLVVEIRFFEREGRIIRQIDASDEELTSVGLNISTFFAIPKGL
jgi:hypothetical protein